MLPFDRLIKLIQQASIFPTVCLISNGYYLSQQLPDKRLNSLQDLDKVISTICMSRYTYYYVHVTTVYTTTCRSL